MKYILFIIALFSSLIINAQGVVRRNTNSASQQPKKATSQVPTKRSRTNISSSAPKAFYSNGVLYVNGVSYDMVKVQAGTFIMGANSETKNPYEDEILAHLVTLTNDYYIGKTEVTQALWKAVTGYSPKSSGSQWEYMYSIGNNYPAYFISYNDALSFITQLNSLTGKTFRLPTEAEWEFAARGGNKSKGYQYSGSNIINDVAKFDGNKHLGSPKIGGVFQVKTKSPNELGLYDMSGNAREWCSDWYGIYSGASQTDPTGPTSGSSRVIRGGSFLDQARRCNVSGRNYLRPDLCDCTSGFRLVLSE